MKLPLASAALLLGGLVAASGQAPKPAASDFWSRAAGDAAKPKAAAPAAAAPPGRSPAEVYAAFGMTGSWAYDCARPVSRTNPRLEYRIGEGGRLTGTTRVGAEPPAHTEIREAAIDAAGRLRAAAFLRFEDLPDAQRLALGTDGARPSLTTVTTFAKAADGSVTPVESIVTVEGTPSKFVIVDGYQFDTRTQAKGAKVPPRFRCPDAAEAGATAALTPPVQVPPVQVPPVQVPPPQVPPSITALGGDGLVAERIRHVVGGLTVTAPRVELRGTGLSREDLARLLAPATPGDLRARLATATVREIVVPELRIEAASAADGVMILRDIRLSDLTGGRIGTVTAGPGTGTFGAADRPGRLDLARFEAAGFDLGHLLGLAGSGAADPEPALKRVFAGAALEGLAVAGPDGDGVRVARIAARDPRARRTADGIGAAFDRIATALDKDGAPPGADSRALAAAADLLGAFEIGGLELVGLEFQGRDKGTARIARIGLAAASGTPGSLRLDGFEGTSPDGTARVAAFSVDDVSLRGLIDGMAAMARSGTALGPAEARRLVPQVGAIRLGRVEVVPAGKVAGKEGDKGAGGSAAPFTVDAVEVASADLLDGLPTRMRVSMRNLSVPVAALSDRDASGELAGLGYADIATTIRADLGWSESSRQLAVHELAVEGGGMGTATLRAVLGNVSRDLFSPDPETAKRAVLGAGAQSLDLDIQDRGLLDRVLANQAKRQGVSVEDLRMEVAAYARLGIPGALGDMPGGTELGQAVARFVARPGRLSVRARATEPAGISLAQVAATADPSTLLGRFAVTASTD